MKRFALAACFLVLLGCRSVVVHKHDPVVFVPPGQTNVVAVAEGGWDARYFSYGLFTSFGHLEVSVSTNVVRLALSDLNSDVSSNHVSIIVAGGDAAGDAAEHVIDALKHL